MSSDAELRSQSYIPRKHHHDLIHLHAAFTFLTAEQAKPYFLLIDRAEGNVWMWQLHLRYLGDWAKRAGPKHRCPPLLIVCPSHFRAGAMLRLTRSICPNLTVIATGCRDIALSEGLLAVSKQPKGWRLLLPNNTPAPIDPFALPGIPRAVYESSPFAIDKLARAAHVGETEVKQEQASDMSRFVSLDEQQHQVLAFLCRNPVIPESAIDICLAAPPATLQNHILHLEQDGFAYRIKTNIAEPIWAATDLGAQLRFEREMQPANHLRRYRFFRADHERRLMHTLGVYRFFESIQQHCERRSRATRKLDAKPDELNDGRVQMFVLKTWESEFMASDGYVLRGQMHFWRPDGYGAVRAGKMVTHFWLELDGTASAPSRFDPEVWMGKLGRLCDYVQSRRWTFRYPKLPRLLIVTTDLRNLTHIYDALAESAQARGMHKLPKVLVAGSTAVQQRGPLAKVWLDVAQEDETWCYAFDGLEMHTLQARVPKRVNVLDELQRADSLGLLAVGGS